MNIAEKPEGEKTQYEVPKDFKDSVDRILTFFEDIKPEIRKKLRFYGHEIRKTSKGDEIGIDILGYMGPNPEREITENDEVLALIARERDGSIAGLRTCKISDDQHGYLKATGEILTAKRGEGFASVIDASLEDMLGKILKKYQEKGEYTMVWDVHNANLKRTEDLVSRSEIGEEELKRRKQEQERWQSLYGIGGKLGFHQKGKYSYQKDIKPSEEALSLEPVADVFIDDLVVSLKKV